MFPIIKYKISAFNGSKPQKPQTTYKCTYVHRYCCCDCNSDESDLDKRTNIYSESIRF